MKPSPTVRTLTVQRQVFEQRLALVERADRRLVDARADHEVLDLEVLQVAPGHEADLAAELEAVVDVAAQVEVERQVVDLEGVRAPVGEPLAVQRQIELARLERDQVRELDAAGADPRRADDQDALVVEHDAHVVEDDALVADLDDTALNLDLGPHVAQAEVDRAEIEAPAHLRLLQRAAEAGADVRLALRVRDGVGRDEREQARADVAVDVGLDVLGREPGAERRRGRPASSSNRRR